MPTSVRDGQSDYIINMCGEVPTHLCVSKDSYPVHTHICRKTPNGAVGYGSDLIFTRITETNSTEESFAISFGDGDPCPYQPSRKTMASIKFVCDKDGDFGRPVLRRDISDDCSVHFEWHTNVACRACLYPQDYKKIEGPCAKNGLREVLMQQKIQCFDARLDKSPITEPCSPTVAFPIVVVVLAVIIFIIFVFIAVGLFIKHRKLETEYESLLHRTPGEHGFIDRDSDGEL